MSAAQPPSRKRSLNEVDGLTETLGDSSLTASNPKTEEAMKPIQSLALEAIFHPKFENENREMPGIRLRMIEKIEKSEGYLEVSLKHSGTLLLWSGAQRFYSKNSTDNVFTMVGEVLLRQHFYRAWFSSTDRTGRIVYEECSDFVERNRLTLAFEVVTSVLGHHGDLPRKDFLILTAVAERSSERFYSTVEVLEFAQRYHLPHNDVWVYLSPSSVGRLFHLYDTTRETGLADGTIRELSQSADSHVSSMYPHIEFQGNILEGLVIRYVAFMTGEREAQQQCLDKLAVGSADILCMVPVSTPPSFELSGNMDSLVLSVNIRNMYDACIAEGGYTDLLTRLADKVSAVLKQADSRRRIIKRATNKEWNIPQLAQSLLVHDSIDKETRRIATVITKLDTMNAAVRYSVQREDDLRWLCTIHVLHDRTFMAFQKQMDPKDMHLYRGFTIEMGTGTRETLKDVPTQNEVADEIKEAVKCDASLMLKMKFLPYMVRTFCCRNGLKIVSQGGPNRFAEYTLKMMKTWGISAESQARWQPFFRAWGQYAKDCISGTGREYLDKSLPPLTEFFYLNHLEYCIHLYESGLVEFEGSAKDDRYDDSTYRAMVVVVAMDRETADFVSGYISRELGCLRIHKDINTLTEEDFLSMRSPRGGGVVVSAIIEDGCGKIRKFSRQHGNSVSIILVGCDPESVESSLLPERKRLQGMAKGWEKINVTYVKHIAKEKLLLPSTDFDEEMSEEMTLDPNLEVQELLETLRKVSDQVPVLDGRRGVLIFFPSVPGSGKSALTAQCTRDRLTRILESLPIRQSTSTVPPRRLVTLVGDELKKKYWPHVKKIRADQPSCVLIADKNAPVNAWTTVGESAGHGLVVPVFPDRKALSTTRVEGILKSTREADISRSHYYPFSMHFMAACITRVLSRAAKSHVGGLDCSLPYAAMVVLRFFGLYRNISSERFFDILVSRVESSGATCARAAVEVPFFVTEDLIELPREFSEALLDGLKLQYGYETEKKDPVESYQSDFQVQALEQRLREMVARHKDKVLQQTVEETESISAFVDQVADIIREVDEESTLPGTEVKVRESGRIKLVAVDIKAEEVHNFLKSVASSHRGLTEALAEMGAVLSEECFSDKAGFELRSHVTMAHGAHMSQETMATKFESLVGNSVDIKITGLLWSERIAALQVELPSHSDEGNIIPPSTNEFTHITLWRKETQAVESNDLPLQVQQGKASKLIFDSPIEIRGKVNFWHVN